MRHFITKFFYFSLIGIIPAMVLAMLYFYFDPFKVLKNYDDYSYPYVINNRDNISTTMYIRNHKKQRYNSFVFGSSRTLAFKPDSWKVYLDRNDTPFMFDASCESVDGIYNKLRYLDASHADIKNVLIILCRDVSFDVAENHKGHLFIQHPATTGESTLGYQFEFFKAYFNPKFLINFYSYKLLGTYKPFMAGFIENRKVTFDTITNEINIVDQENEIIKDPKAYYEKRFREFPIRKGEQIDSVQRIDNQKKLTLQKIKRLLDKNRTHYKVVLSPLYEQIRFSESDHKILKNIFGENLYDFSGKNKFTGPMTNYYEKNHFRPIVGDSILSTIYR